MSKITDRLSEPSSYPSLAAIIYGIGELFKIKETPVIVDAVSTAGETVAATGDWKMGLGALILGAFGFFMKEKGSK